MEDKDLPLDRGLGPGVPVGHVAITDEGTSKLVMNLVSTILPVGWFISLAKTAQVGAVSIEVDLTDARTGQRVAVMEDSRAGRNALRTKFYGTRSDVKMAFDWWANQSKTCLLPLKRVCVIQRKFEPFNVSILGWIAPQKFKPSRSGQCVFVAPTFYSAV